MTDPPTMVIVLSTFPADEDAAPLARALVEERLAACVNILPPMSSIYRWEGRVEQATEHQLIVKTTTARVDALRARLVELHPYDVPEIIVLPASTAAPSYLDWVVLSVGEAPPSGPGEPGNR